jgi:hypothetical protein
VNTGPYHYGGHGSGVILCKIVAILKVKQVNREQILKRREITEVEQNVQCCKRRRVPAPTAVHRAALTCSFCHYANEVSQDIYASYFQPSHVHVTAHFIRIPSLVTVFIFFILLLFSFTSAAIKSTLPQEKNICATKMFGTCVTINRLIMPISLFLNSIIFSFLPKYMANSNNDNGTKQRRFVEIRFSSQ